MTDSDRQHGRPVGVGRRSQGEEYPGRDVARTGFDQPEAAPQTHPNAASASERQPGADPDPAGPDDVAYLGTAVSAFGPLPWRACRRAPDGYEKRRLVENLEPVDCAPAGHDPQLAPAGRLPSTEQLPGEHPVEKRRPGGRWAMTDRQARTSGRPDPPGILVPATHGRRSTR